MYYDPPPVLTLRQLVNLANSSPDITVAVWDLTPAPPEYLGRHKSYEGRYDEIPEPLLTQRVLAFRVTQLKGGHRRTDILRMEIEIQSCHTT